MTLLAIAAVLLIGTFADSARAQLAARPANPIRPQVVYQSSRESGLGAIRVVARNQAEFDRYWAIIGNGSATPPAIDFSKDMVLILSLGYQGAGGSSIAVSAVRDQDGALDVSDREGDDNVFDAGLPRTT
ncbi:MAG TPA: hypothetical protein VK636_06310 [Gemmatimonadaceae bacterium]|nr:hypothetical protein [Gemmatimonadaceae bacterium]